MAFDRSEAIRELTAIEDWVMTTAIAAAEGSGNDLSTLLGTLLAHVSNIATILREAIEESGPL